MDDDAYFSKSLEKERLIQDIIVSSIEQPVKIGNTNRLIRFIDKITLNSDNYYNFHELFYRGHSKASYKVQPSVFRNHHANEDVIFQELLLATPADFIEDKTTFDKLVRMQHYGLPTRLLDITTNPLVALYFACCENFKEDGELLLFNIDKGNIKYFDSDTVSILSNLSRLKIEEKCKRFTDGINTAIDSQSDLFSTFYLLLMAKYINATEVLFGKNEEIAFIKEQQLGKSSSENRQFEILTEVKNGIKEFEIVGNYIVLFMDQAYEVLREYLSESILNIQENITFNQDGYEKGLNKISSYLIRYIEFIKIVFSSFEFLNFKEITNNLDEKVKSIVDKNIPSYIPENILNKSIIDELSSLNSALQELIEDCLQNKPKSLNPLLQSVISEIAKHHQKSDEIDVIRKKSEKEIIRMFNDNHIVQKLLHFIKDEKPAFRPIINPQDLDKVICVKAKKNNERIISQSGEFLLFGNKECLYKYSVNDNIQIIRLIIPKKSKQNIIKELNLLNINQATLFPDIQSRANHIKEKYDI